MSTDSPTLPLPPPSAITLSDLIETTAASVGRALDARNLGEGTLISQHRIIIGIIFDPRDRQQLPAQIND